MKDFQKTEEKIIQLDDHIRQHWGVESQFKNCDKGKHSYIYNSNKCQICGKQKINNSEFY